jgi:hypothetical protein
LEPLEAWQTTYSPPPLLLHHQAQSNPSHDAPNMPTNQHQDSSSEAAARAKKARRLADDNIMARQLAEYLENPRKNTIQADDR